MFLAKKNRLFMTIFTEKTPKKHDKFAIFRPKKNEEKKN